MVGYTAAYRVVHPPQSFFSILASPLNSDKATLATVGLVKVPVSHEYATPTQEELNDTPILIKAQFLTIQGLKVGKAQAPLLVITSQVLPTVPLC